jgi:hypothetical protein
LLVAVTVFGLQLQAAAELKPCSSGVAYLYIQVSESRPGASRKELTILFRLEKKKAEQQLNYLTCLLL